MSKNEWYKGNERMMNGVKKKGEEGRIGDGKKSERMNGGRENVEQG